MKNLLLVFSVIDCNTNLLGRIVRKILRSPVKYFDTTPSGRILNRFSSDMGQLDLMLVQVSADAMEIPIQFVTILIRVITLYPYFLIISFFMAFGVLRFFLFVKGLIIQGKKLDMMFKSPIFGFFSTSLGGIQPVRVYKQQEQFFSKMLVFCDRSSQANKLFFWLSRAFGYFIELQCNIAYAIGIFVIIPISLSNGDTGSAA